MSGDLETVWDGARAGANRGYLCVPGLPIQDATRCRALPVLEDWSVERPEPVQAAVGHLPALGGQGTRVYVAVDDVWCGPSLIAGRSGVHRATTFRWLTVLRRHGLVERRRYHLGGKCHGPQWRSEYRRVSKIQGGDAGNSAGVESLRTGVGRAGDESATL